MNFHSEFGEDKWIYENLLVNSGKRAAANDGFYLDVGCMHPNVGSNTAFLRDLGWTGLVIDGNAALARDWEGIPGAKFVPAVLSNQEFGRFKCHENSQMSRLQPDGDPVTCRTLEDVLREHRVGGIDLVSIDIEGAEFDVMAGGFNFLDHRPRIIIAEYATLELDGTVREDFRLRDFLVKMDYQAVHQTRANLIYVRAG